MKINLFDSEIPMQCGAIIAFLIGSGFASGQEVFQFFSAYGLYQSLGALLISLLIFLIITVTVIKDATERKVKSPSIVFEYYCGAAVGKLMEILSPVILFMIYVVMISGGGILLSEVLHISPLTGRIVFTFIVGSTVMLGLKHLVNIIGGIGNIIIFLVLSVGFICLCRSWENIGVTENIMMTVADNQKATPYWWLSGITYSTFCAVTILPFLVEIGRHIRNSSNAVRVGVLSSCAFILAAAVLSLSMIANASDIISTDIPSVTLANSINSRLGLIFTMCMVAGVFTTAVPMLWSCCNRISRNEKSLYFKGGVLFLSAISNMCTNVSFLELVNLIYPYIGYIGMFIVLGILKKQLFEPAFLYIEGREQCRR